MFFQRRLGASIVILIMWFYCCTSCLVEYICLVSRKAFNKLDKIDCILEPVCVGFMDFHPPASPRQLVVLNKIFSGKELNKAGSCGKAGKVQVVIDHVFPG